MAFVPGTASEVLKIDVELTISAKDILNKDVMSKSDPMCVVYTQLSHSQAWTEHGRTERAINTLNPEFSTKIVMQYHFETLQKLKFKLYDIDSHSSSLEDHDFLGETECNLGQIVSSGTFVAKLNHPKNPHSNSQLIVKAEEIGDVKEEVEFKFSAKDFKKSGVFSKPDPFLAIYKGNTIVFRTQHVQDNCNPDWPKFSLPMRALRTKTNEDVELTLQCWNWNGNGNHKLMGEVKVKSSDILKAPNTFSLSDKEKAGKSVGKLCLDQAVVRKTHSFLDFISNGTQLNCSIAIDFTGSNGAPNSPSSLHYMGPTPTLYEHALQSIVPIVQDYDSDKQFPVLGFGAKIPPHGNLSHEFFVNMSQSPFCHRVEGVIEAYRRCLPLVQLYGPTNFAPVIEHVSRFASNHPNGDNYFILLILTDGEISDMNETKKAIVAASHLPMSIIIVGIGNANFASMSELDSDNGLLSAGGRTASRDIVQFVAFRDYLNQPDPYRAGQDLARALLAEIPNQLVSFMKSKNLSPKVAN